jgi:hypothetical protein
MDARKVSLALNDRLGPNGVAGLLELVDSTHNSWRDEVTTLVMDRFDARLAKESSLLRSAINAGEQRLREELRAEIGDSAAKLRYEMQDWGQSIRTEILNGVSQVRQEILQQQAQLLKLCFTFWVGQTLVIVAVVGAIVGAFAR